MIATNNNLTVQGGNVGANEIAQGCAVTPGYFYFEWKYESGTAADDDGVGISLPTATAANVANSGTNAVITTTNNHTYVNGAASTAPGAIAVGGYAQVCIDTVNGRYFVDTVGNGVGTIGFGNNPIGLPSFGSSGTPIDISAIFNSVNADICALFRTSTADKFTLNNGPSFRYRPPPGYSSGWNGRDYNIYSGFNTATALNSAFNGPGNYAILKGGGASAFGAISKTSKAGSSGKFYIEYTVSQRGGNEYFGVSGTGYVIGNATGANFKGSNIGVSNKIGQLAVDTTAKLLWFRDDFSGSWNSGDPGLGTGGLDISGLGFPIFFTWAETVNQSATFLVISDPRCQQKSPPTGFTAGWL